MRNDFIRLEGRNGQEFTFPRAAWDALVRAASAKFPGLEYGPDGAATLAGLLEAGRTAHGPARPAWYADAIAACPGFFDGPARTALGGFLKRCRGGPARGGGDVGEGRHGQP